MDYNKHFAKILREMENRNKEIIKATSLSSKMFANFKTINITREKLQSKFIQGNALEELVKNTRTSIQKMTKVAPSINSSLPIFPKINFKLPKFKINYERIERITNHNSSHGWTLTEEFPINFYLDDEYLTLGQIDLDNIFVAYYEADGYKEFKRLIEVLLKGLNVKWKEIITDTYHLYLDGKFRMCVPALITIIEGEISELVESVKIGGKLLGDFENSIEENDKYLAIASYSILFYFQEKLFKGHSFSKERMPMINRNWILHGRDNPEFWGKADALRLLNTLSTIQFLKTVKWEVNQKEED